MSVKLIVYYNVLEQGHNKWVTTKKSMRGKKRTQQKLPDNAFDKVLMIGTGKNISLSLIMTWEDHSRDISKQTHTFNIKTNWVVVAEHLVTFNMYCELPMVKSATKW